MPARCLGLQRSAGKEVHQSETVRFCIGQSDQRGSLIARALAWRSAAFGNRFCRGGGAEGQPHQKRSRTRTANTSMPRGFRHTISAPTARSTGTHSPVSVASMARAMSVTVPMAQARVSAQTLRKHSNRSTITSFGLSFRAASKTSAHRSNW